MNSTMALCYTCNTKLSSNVCIQLDSNISLDNGKKYYEKIDELLGIESFVRAKFSEKLCKQCSSLLKNINKLENEMKLSKNKFLLKIKKKSESSVVGHNEKGINLQDNKEFDKLDITDKGTKMTANDNNTNGCSSLQMLQNEKLNLTNSDVQSHFLTKNDKEANETLAKPPSVTQVVNKQSQPDEKLDCDVFNKKINISSNDKSLDSALKILKDKNGNGKIAVSTTRTSVCNSCFLSFEDSKLKSSHVCPNSIKKNDRETDDKPQFMKLLTKKKKLLTDEKSKTPIQPDSSINIYSCGLCQRCYTNPEHLYSHMLLDFNEKNDKNSIETLAKSSFLTQVGIKPKQTNKELPVFEVEKPVTPVHLYTCNLCKMSYNDLEMLSGHMCSYKSTENIYKFMETLPKPSTSKQIPAINISFKCKLCSLVFETSRSCLTHIKDYHKDNLPNKKDAEVVEKYGGKKNESNEASVLMDYINFLKNYSLNDQKNDNSEITVPKRKKYNPLAIDPQETDEEKSERRKELKEKLALKRRLAKARS